MEKYRYDIRQVDAWNDCEGGWIWNTSYHLGCLATGAADHKKAFLSYLRRNLDIRPRRGMCRVAYDGSVYELQDRRTGEPLIAAVPMF